MIYFWVCILCIYKKGQTNLKVCFINTALIDCFLFYQQERGTAFQAAHLEKLGWCFACRAPDLHHPAGIPASSSKHRKFAPIFSHPFLVGTWGRKEMRRNTVEVKHSRTSGGEDSMRAGSCRNLVGHAGGLGHVPSSLRRTQRVTVISFWGGFWNLQMKSLYIKAKYYCCPFYPTVYAYAWSTLLLLLSFLTQTGAKKDIPKRIASLWWAILFEIMVVGSSHCFLGISHSFSPLMTPHLQSVWAMCDGHLQPGQAVEERALSPSIKLLVWEVISIKI